MKITLYAYINIDAIRLGKHYAKCTTAKPNLSHSEYAIWEMEVDLSDSIEYTDKLNEYNQSPHVCVDWSDYDSIAPQGDMTWCGLYWHITSHRLLISYQGDVFAVLKGSHVKHWREV